MGTAHFLQRGLLALVVLTTAASAQAQVRQAFPGSAPQASFQGAQYGMDDAGLVPVAPAPAYSGGILGNPSAFDPYSTIPGNASIAPSFSGPGHGSGQFGAPAPGVLGPPTTGFYGAGPDCAPQFPHHAPPVVFPGPDTQFVPPSMAGTMRLVQMVQLEHTFIFGGEADDHLQINDTIVSVPLAFPNFLFSGQPIVVAPTFGLHLWEGPGGDVADLPGQAYSAYLDASWVSNPAVPFGVELASRVGVFSDFDTFTSDSIRIQGLGLGRIQATPATTIKVGAMYLDRVRIKLLPAGGIFWRPNPQTKFDVFFPEPKLAQYLTTLGTQDVWWYLRGEYGGGSWTIERAHTGATDQVDINDIRLMVGLEWGPNFLIQQDHRRGFFEVGWVTDRELRYRYAPQDNIRLRDSVMLRGGLNW